MNSYFPLIKCKFIINLAHQSIQFFVSCFVLACETGARKIWNALTGYNCLFPSLGQFSMVKAHQYQFIHLQAQWECFVHVDHMGCGFDTRFSKSKKMNINNKQSKQAQCRHSFFVQLTFFMSQLKKRFLRVSLQGKRLLSQKLVIFCEQSR